MLKFIKGDTSYILLKIELNGEETYSYYDPPTHPILELTFWSYSDFNCSYHQESKFAQNMDGSYLIVYSDASLKITP